MPDDLLTETPIGTETRPMLRELMSAARSPLPTNRPFIIDPDAEGGLKMWHRLAHSSVRILAARVSACSSSWSGSSDTAQYQEAHDDEAERRVGDAEVTPRPDPIDVCLIHGPARSDAQRSNGRRVDRHLPVQDARHPTAVGTEGTQHGKVTATRTGRLVGQLNTASEPSEPATMNGVEHSLQI